MQRELVSNVEVFKGQICQVSNLCNAYFTCSVDGTLLDFDPQILLLYGYTKEEFLTVKACDLFCEPYGIIFMNTIRYYKATRDTKAMTLVEGLTLWARHKDQTLFNVVCTMLPLEKSVKELIFACKLEHYDVVSPRSNRICMSLDKVYTHATYAYSYNNIDDLLLVTARKNNVADG